MRHLMLLQLLGACLVTLSAQGTPTNDNFAARVILTGTNVSVEGSNAGAGTEPGEDIGGSAVYWFDSVWYAWRAPTNGVLHLNGSTTAPSFFMSIRAYGGDALGSLTLAPTTPDGGVPVAPGDTLAIQVASIYYPVWSGGGGSGPFTLTLSLEVPRPASSNDMFANRVTITHPTYQFTGSIYGATSEPGEPLPAPGANQTLWWSFLPPADGVLRLSFAAPQFTPEVAVYEGAQFGAMTRVIPITGGQYPVAKGKEYAIQAATGEVPGGALTLEGRFYLVANDAFTGSTRIEGTNVTVSGTTAGATSEPGEPVPFGTNTIWFSWAAPATGRVQFVGRNIAVYTGSRVDQLQTVRTMGAPNSRYSFLALQDRVYHFQATGGPEVSFPLQFWRYSPATNDLFAAPTLLKGQSVNTMETDWWAFTDAGMEQWEPAHLGTTPARSLWFKWQAPVHGTASFHTEVSLATNVVTSVYEGVALESLRPVAKGTNQVQFPVTGGNWYYLAAAVPTNAVGDFLPYGSVFRSAGSRAVPGNLLQEPSWEGTALNNARSWHWTGGLGGYINAPYGGCDGTTWPALGTGTTLWQDFTAIAGHEYAVRFAYFVGGDLSSCCGDARVRVRWDNRVLGEAVLAGSESGYWHWAEFRALASNTVSRVSFENLARDVEMDAFSVVDLSSPPQIVNEPASISTVAGGTAAFAVGATGSDPLQYQWFFNGAVLAGQTSRYLILESVTTNDSGGYFVTVTNGFGAVTSAPATLYVDAPATPLIVWQPYGDTVPAGGYYSFSVAAAGLPPLTYQWFFHQEALPGATNKTLEFTNVQPAQAGDYQVLVQNPAGGVWSLQALLRVSGADSGGGMIWFGNRYPVGLTNIDAPVLNLDGVTPLDGERYLAQLYAGPSLELLRPAGRPSAFLSGASAGYFRNQTITLANVPAGTAAVVQVRVWEADRGTTYEEARALGGRFGKSELLQVITTEAPTPPAGLTGLKSFSLQAGLPRWTAGVIEFVERQPKGVVVWSLKGAPGFRYLIERAERDQPWQPFVVLTNATGTVTFTDSAESGASTVFFRSRILD